MVDHQLVREGSFKADDGYSLTGELLDLDPPPDALIVASNRLSRGVFQQVRERALTMPDDLAVCVFDDLPMFSYQTPSITAVSYDIEAFTDQAVRFLCERIDGHYDGAARTALTPCKLRARESTLGVRIGPVSRRTAATV
jgi:LacI family transcriptional regulator